MYYGSDYINELAGLSCAGNGITADLYDKYSVFRGLRDVNGKGVITGLTEISAIKAKEITDDGREVPCQGKLSYRGYDIKDIVNSLVSENRRFGFEETVYLLLLSELPNGEQLKNFCDCLCDFRTLPPSFVRDMILKAPCKDMMNMLSRSVLALYAYDDNPDDISITNVLRQCIFLISVFPILSVYGYQSYRHYIEEKSLIIHNPLPQHSTAENILHLLRDDGEFTPLEARVLDLALVLHAEHGGGNNSTFTTHVVTSSGTDTYSAFSAALGSLKGPRHGGANIKVVQMMDNIKNNVAVKSDANIKDYLSQILDKNAFDNSGLIYGMGHAVYSLSDPRAEILKKCAEELSVAKNNGEEYALYEKVARLAPEVISGKRKMYKGVSANVDFYSGLIYSMLNLPRELFTPVFASARVAGWSAHRIEELQNAGKIIRPAYINVKQEREYVSFAKR